MDKIMRLNWTLLSRLLSASVLFAAIAACSSPSTPLTPAQQASESSAVSAEAAAAQSMMNSYNHSTPPTTTSSPTTAEPTTTGEFTRTWTKDYAKTTCKEFMTVMTGQQGFVAAADMLVNARQNTDQSLPFPSGDLINAFNDDVPTICSTGVIADDESIVTVAGIVLTTAEGDQHYLK